MNGSRSRRRGSLDRFHLCVLVGAPTRKVQIYEQGGATAGCGRQGILSALKPLKELGCLS